MSQTQCSPKPQIHGLVYGQKEIYEAENYTHTQKIVSNNADDKINSRHPFIKVCQNLLEVLKGHILQKRRVSIHQAPPFFSVDLPIMFSIRFFKCLKPCGVLVITIFLENIVIYSGIRNEGGSIVH